MCTVKMKQSFLSEGAFYGIIDWWEECNECIKECILQMINKILFLKKYNKTLLKAEVTPG